MTKDKLAGKTIILGISGGIAAYKTVDLVSQLKKLGADVHVICTENALRFVSKLSLETMSANPVHDEQYSETSPYIDHIVLADKADLILLAPTTANIIGKLASGISDTLLTDFCLASKAPVIMAPAMNTNMWEHKIVQKNISVLCDELNYQLIEPDSGELACGHVGPGRLAELDKIINKVCEFFGVEALPSELALDSLALPSYETSDLLKGKRVIVTAGGTREPIDPVRFIGNRSSGKMGFALASAALLAGAELTFISTVPLEQASKGKHPVLFDSSNKIKEINVESANEMKAAVEAEFAGADVLIMAAAVADYQPEQAFATKIKKNKKSDSLEMKLQRTPDILKEISKQKRSNQILVGFALETEQLIDNAKQKLKEKNIDLIVANDIKAFNSDESQVFLISKDSKALTKSIEKQSKREIAKLIINEIADRVIKLESFLTLSSKN